MYIFHTNTHKMNTDNLTRRGEELLICNQESADHFTAQWLTNQCWYEHSVWKDSKPKPLRIIFHSTAGLQHQIKTSSPFFRMRVKMDSQCERDSFPKNMEAFNTRSVWDARVAEQPVATATHQMTVRVHLLSFKLLKTKNEEKKNKASFTHNTKSTNISLSLEYNVAEFNFST